MAARVQRPAPAPLRPPRPPTARAGPRRAALPPFPGAAAADLPLHALTKLPYGKLAGHRIGVRDGVLFLTYSALIASTGG